MMKEPVVSIIMPVYNTAPYLDKAIHSVLIQTYVDFELLLINDGSTDESFAKLQDWSHRDKRIKVISQDNQGLSATRNKGLSLARGEYIYFIDSDDCLRQDTLTSCISYARQLDLDMVYFDADIFADEGIDVTSTNFNYSRKTTVALRPSNGCAALEEQLDKGEFFSSACLYVVRKDYLLANNLHFMEGIIHEDELFTVLLYAQAKRVAYLPERFFLRRVRAGSIMTRQFTWYNIACYLKVAGHLRAFAQQYPQYSLVIDKYLTRMLNAAIWKAHLLPWQNRWRLFCVGMKQWNKFIHVRTYGVLLFKKIFSSL